MTPSEDNAQAVALKDKSKRRRFWESASKWGFIVPIVLSGATWLMSMETRLHEYAERLTQERGSIDELDKRVRGAEVAANDPHPRPIAVAEIAAMKKVLDEHGERFNSMDERINQLQAAVADPRPKPEAAVAMEAMKATLQERGDRINRLEDRMNNLSRTLLEGTVITRDGRPAPKPKG